MEYPEPVNQSHENCYEMKSSEHEFDNPLYGGVRQENAPNSELYETVSCASYCQFVSLIYAYDVTYIYL